VYTSRPGEWKPELGDYLGDLTDEVTDNRIIELSLTKFIPITRIWSLVNMSKYSTGSDMYFIRGMLDLCSNFPQNLFSISLANALNPGFFFMSL
jgi:hypothetical protein